MRIIQHNQWSRRAEKDVMQEKLPLDFLCIKQSASIAVWENEAIPIGKIAKTTDDSHTKSALIPSFLAFGKHYTHSRTPCRYALIRFQPHGSLQDKFRPLSTIVTTKRPNRQSKFFLFLMWKKWPFLQGMSAAESFLGDLCSVGTHEGARWSAQPSSLLHFVLVGCRRGW